MVHHPLGREEGEHCVQVKGITEVARLVGEVEDLRNMMESLKRMVTGQGLEETSGETGDREVTLEEAEEREKCVGEKTRDNSSTEESEGRRRRRRRRRRTFIWQNKCALRIIIYDWLCLGDSH